MGTQSVSAARRITGWLFSFFIFAGVVLLSGKQGAVFADARLSVLVLGGIAAVGELLARLGSYQNARVLARGEEMRALIAPFYSTLRRTVQAQAQDGAEAPAVQIPAFEFDAATASIVQDEELSYQDEGGRFVYEIRRYARSPEGEYFWMILEAVNGTPQLTYIKHVEQHIARYALGSRYVAPPRMA